MLKITRRLLAVLSVAAFLLVLGACGSTQPQPATAAANDTDSTRASSALPAASTDASSKGDAAPGGHGPQGSTAPEPAASNSTKDDAGNPARKVAEQPAAATPSRLAMPETLKHDAYRYLGLGNDKPVTMKLGGMENGAVMSSVQTNSLKEVKDGKAVFESESVINGTIRTKVEYTVTNEGVFAREPAAGLDAKPQMELPVDLTPGRTWKAKEKHVADGRTVTTDTTSRIIGIRQLQTAKGKFAALLIEEKGTMTEGGVTSPIVSKMWLVKDIGPVRNEMTMRTPKAKKPVLIVGEIQ